MTSIHALLARVAELDSAATRGPWRSVVDGDGFRLVYRSGGIELVAEAPPSNRNREEDAALAAEYRTAAPAMARVLQAVLETCETIALPPKRADPTGEISDAIEAVTDAIKHTITRALEVEG